MLKLQGDETADEADERLGISSEEKKRCQKMTNKVKEIQDFLHKRGIDVTGTSIINAAIDLTRRLGAGNYTFVCEFEKRKSK